MRARARVWKQRRQRYGYVLLLYDRQTTRRKKVGDILFSGLDAFMATQTDDPTGQDAQTDARLVATCYGIVCHLCFHISFGSFRQLKYGTIYIRSFDPQALRHFVTAMHFSEAHYIVIWNIGICMQYWVTIDPLKTLHGELIILLVFNLLVKTINFAAWVYLKGRMTN